MQRATWDGLAVSREKPYGASVVVWRYIDGEREFLLLHRRAPGGPDFAGDWAWTPPGEARLPGESIDQTARRELREETGPGGVLSSHRTSERRTGPSSSCTNRRTPE
jgi:8-oxo-dGTP pyrophosphatase MutT (NUDIX family)